MRRQKENCVLAVSYTHLVALASSETVRVCLAKSQSNTPLPEVTKVVKGSISIPFLSEQRDTITFACSYQVKNGQSWTLIVIKTISDYGWFTFLSLISS